MSISSVIQPTTATTQNVAAKVRNLIAQHLGVEAERVTDEAHFLDDLGADWLDRLELMIIVEDQFACAEFTDDVVDQTLVVGDLIRFVEGADSRRPGVMVGHPAAVH
jgi:acyl carrier protein